MADQSAKLDPAIRSYYDRRPEEDRLTAGPSQLEAYRTRSLIERHISPAPATVLDIGGAAGAYALWLAERGYAVHLIDSVPRLVDVARGRSGNARHPLASCTVGDVRNLGVEDGFADVVLLLGPLYHLTEASDRARALTEARRVLRPGGLLIAAGISRWASCLDGLGRDLFADPAFGPIVERDVREGQHRNPTEQPGYFTTAYFHRPEEFRDEIAGAHFADVRLFGIEGPGWILSDFDARWADPRRRSDMLRVAELLESEPSAVALSGHMLAVARR
jgi:SAM-dependent methyltransferase